MARSSKRRTRKGTKNIRKSGETKLKVGHEEKREAEISKKTMSSSSSLREEGGEGSGCCTPKSQRFRIPEILTCPPAPKKRRPPASAICSIRRSAISFFSNPDLELYFLLASNGGDVSVPEDGRILASS